MEQLNALLSYEPDTSHTCSLLVLTAQPGLLGQVRTESYKPLEEELSRSF